MFKEWSDVLPANADGFALFLDVDGTLLDIASRPDAVVVPPGLVEDLAWLSRRLNGAVALITGRPAKWVEQMFTGAGLYVAGLHGAEWREPDGTMHGVLSTPAYLRGRDKLKYNLAALPGTVFENKGAACAAHFRLVPQYEPQVIALMRAIATEVGTDWVLQYGKAVVELRPAGRDTLAAFMATPPFAGRRPLAIGDDITDEAMFAAAIQFGGIAVHVGNTLANDRPICPADIRQWIGRVSQEVLR